MIWNRDDERQKNSVFLVCSSSYCLFFFITNLLFYSTVKTMMMPQLHQPTTSLHHYRDPLPHNPQFMPVPQKIAVLKVLLQIFQRSKQMFFITIIEILVVVHRIPK